MRVKHLSCAIALLLLASCARAQKVQGTIYLGPYVKLTTNWAIFASGPVSVENIDGTNKHIYYNSPFNYNPDVLLIPGLDNDFAQGTAVFVYAFKPLVKVFGGSKVQATASGGHLLATTDWLKYSNGKIMVEELDGRNQHIYPSTYRNRNPNAMQLPEIDADFAQGTQVNVYDLDHALLTNDNGFAINTTNFDSPFSVNGLIRAKEIKVENSNWPDFVFSEHYQLLSLSETEKLIKRDGHLPGIPSATEVQKDGVKLGEVNAKLLQKIEELTLHLIEMQKKNDARDKLIEAILSNQRKTKK